MQASTVKLVTAAVIAILAVTGISVIDFTADSVDARQGVMIDFGYYEMDWIEMEFPEGMTRDQALDEACSGKSYMVVRNDDGSVYSVNNKTQLLNVEWGMYILNGVDDLVPARPLPGAEMPLQVSRMCTASASP